MTSRPAYIVTIYMAEEGAVLDHKLGLKSYNEIILVCRMCVQVHVMCLHDSKHLCRGQSTLPDVVLWVLGWLVISPSLPPQI